MLQFILQDLRDAVQVVCNARPLILNLANYVTANFVANSLLAVGAAPIMTVCKEEIAELVEMSQALSLNIGTLSNDFVSLCNDACEVAAGLNAKCPSKFEPNTGTKYERTNHSINYDNINQSPKVIILDPVGVGATTPRTITAASLLKSVHVVRANASEIIALARYVDAHENVVYNNLRKYKPDFSGKTLGVESAHSVNEAKAAAIALATRYPIVVVVTGEVDFITDGRQNVEIPFGSTLMKSVTGMGCALSSIIAAFCSVQDDILRGCTLATLYFALCGQFAAHSVNLERRGIGSFAVAFLDALYGCFRDDKLLEVFLSSNGIRSALEAWENDGGLSVGV